MGAEKWKERIKGISYFFALIAFALFFFGHIEDQGFLQSIKTSGYLTLISTVLLYVFLRFLLWFFIRKKGEF